MSRWIGGITPRSGIARHSSNLAIDLLLHIQHMSCVSIKPDPQAESVISEMAASCVLMRTRLISRVITAIHDEKLRPFGIGSAQFALLVVIFRIQPATRSEIGRFHRQDRSTLTRNLKIILGEGWAREDSNQGDGKRKPIVLTQAGKDLLLASGPAWRAAQIKSKALLGDRGSMAVMEIAGRIMNGLDLD
jgi:DNA-binding MarR family transcriptional regulator